MTNPEQAAREWIYSGGGGLEISKGDERAITVYFEGLVGLLTLYGNERFKSGYDSGLHGASCNKADCKHQNSP